MDYGELKEKIKQELVTRSMRGEWLKGPAIDLLFAIPDRSRKLIIADLMAEGWLIIADKSRGYKIAKTIDEVDAYCDHRKKELITSFRQIKILKNHAHSTTPLFLDTYTDTELENELAVEGVEND
jgi:hypothetical protein